MYGGVSLAKLRWSCPDEQSIVAREEDIGLSVGPEGVGTPGADLVDALAEADGIGDVGFGEHVVEVEVTGERQADVELFGALQPKTFSFAGEDLRVK